MKVYITKYALTKGILEAEAEFCTGTGMINVGRHGYYHGEGKEWHRTREVAVKRAEIMRTNKIESLQKSIAKLEKMTW